MDRRKFVMTAASLAALASRQVIAQDLAVPVSTVFGRTYLDFLDYGALDDLTCTVDQYFSVCTSSMRNSHRLLPMTSSTQPIFRISLEDVGSQSVARIRHRALTLAPNDSITVSSETWADGTVYELFTSKWLTDTYPDSDELWSGQPVGSWGLVVQMKYGQDTAARAILSLPQAPLSIEGTTISIKGEDRQGYDVRVFIDSAASTEAKLLAVERAMYETQSQNPDCKFGTLFAYNEGDPLNDLFTVAQAAVSTDGNGFLEKAFPIMEDRDGTLQVEILGGPFDATPYLLAK